MQEKTVHATLQDSPTMAPWELTDPVRNDLVLGSFISFRSLCDFVRTLAAGQDCTYRIMTLKS